MIPPPHLPLVDRLPSGDGFAGASERTRPRISVVMAVYNGERYLGEAVDSILGQTYRDFEFLIINDGSTDRTREILLSYHDPRIRLVDNGRNLGLARSLNRGLRLATGEFIARQDADDISEPQRFEKQIGYLEAHPEVALLGTWYREIDAGGRRNRYGKAPCDDLDIRWAMLFYCPFVHSSVMLRRSLVLEQVGLYDETIRYGEDYDLWTRIVPRFRVANLPEHLLRLRTHSTSMTSTYGESAWRGHRRRVAAVGSLLGWDEGTAELNETRFAAMTALVCGSGAGLGLEELGRAVGEVFLLQTVFCRDSGIVEAEAERHRAALRSTIAENLAVLAAAPRAARIAAARRLLPSAFRLHPYALLHPRTLLRAGKAFVRSILSGAGRGVR